MQSVEEAKKKEMIVLQTQFKCYVVFCTISLMLCVLLFWRESLFFFKSKQSAQTETNRAGLLNSNQ